MVSGTMSKIAHLTSVHRSDDMRIWRKECQTLAAAGYETLLIAPAAQDEMAGGVQIRALPSANGGADRMRHRLTKTNWQLLRLARKERCALYHLHDPELIPIGLLLKLSGYRVVYDVHEDYPKQIHDLKQLPLWIRELMSRLARAIERWGARCFDGIITATPAIARNFPLGKTTVVQNFPLLHELQSPSSIPFEQRPPWIAYVGGISKIRGIEQVVQAMGRLKANLDTRLKLAGEYSPPHLRDTLQTLPGWQHIDSLGWQSREEVKSLFSHSRAGIVTFHPEQNHLEAQPNKLFEYMSAGIPVIASDFPLWREIVEGNQCGLLVDPLNPETVADAIDWVMNHPSEAQRMGENGRKAVQERYNWERESAQLLEFYRSILK